MKVEVTEEHIKKGSKNKGSACPIFYALNDAYEEFNPNRRVKQVEYIEAVVYENDKYLYHSVFPKQIIHWLYAYDMGLKVSPISFNFGE